MREHSGLAWAADPSSFLLDALVKAWMRALTCVSLCCIHPFSLLHHAYKMGLYGSSLL